MVIRNYEETEDIKALIESGLVNEGIPGFFFIFTKEPTLRNEFPMIVLSKSNVTSEDFIGDNVKEGKGNITSFNLRIEIWTRKGFVKIMNKISYEEDKLVHLISNIIRKIMFDNKDWQKDANSDYMITNYILDDVPQEAFIKRSAYFSRFLSYRIEYSKLFEE